MNPAHLKVNSPQRAVRRTATLTGSLNSTREQTHTQPSGNLARARIVVRSGNDQDPDSRSTHSLAPCASASDGRSRSCPYPNRPLPAAHRFGRMASLSARATDISREHASGDLLSTSRTSASSPEAVTTVRNSSERLLAIHLAACVVAPVPTALIHALLDRECPRTIGDCTRAQAPEGLWSPGLSREPPRR